MEGENTTLDGFALAVYGAEILQKIRADKPSEEFVAAKAFYEKYLLDSTALRDFAMRNNFKIELF